MLFRSKILIANVSRQAVTHLRAVHMADVVQNNIKVILDQVSSSVSASSLTSHCRLVAVSKTKPSELIEACYAVGQRHFGENYVQELEEKSRALESTCPEIRWHYIGQIQSNKVGKIAAAPNLFCVETIESEKQCGLFEKEMSKRDRTLEVLVQVNTSGEEQKGGVSVSDAPALAQHILDNCPHLRFAGFMTIGSWGASHGDGANPDFHQLYEVRKTFCALSGADPSSLHLSMGMSDDFVQAIQQGSTSVRVGSKIFGARIYNK